MIKKDMTAEEIVAGLRNDQPAVRTKALEALFPEEHGALLVRVRAQVVSLTATSTIDADRAFVGALQLAERLGKHLGLRLGWVPDPDQDNKLVVAPGEMLR